MYKGNNMIFEEENIKEILKVSNLPTLAIRINTAIKKIDEDLKRLNNTRNPLTWNDTGANTYKILIKEIWSLKESARDVLIKLSDGTLKVENKYVVGKICHKILSIWSGDRGDIYHKLLEINKAVDNYNIRFPNNKLQHIDEYIGIPIKASVKTFKYFNY